MVVLLKINGCTAQFAQMYVRRGVRKPWDMQPHCLENACLHLTDALSIISNRFRLKKETFLCLVYVYAMAVESETTEQMLFGVDAGENLKT